jgi:hypothetical protein
MNKTRGDLPLVLNAKNISEIMGISQKTAHELMNDTNFPLIRIGKIKRVERDRFFLWLGHHVGQKNNRLIRKEE